MNMAIHSTHFLTSKTLSAQDIFVNVGFSGSSTRQRSWGEISLITKIHSHDSGRDFYPALLYQHPFLESSLESFSRIVSKEDPCQEDLVDMEGAAFFESMSFFAKQRQIILMKVVSDLLEGKNIETQSLEEKMKQIIPWLELFLEEQDSSDFPWKTEGKVASLAKQLYCSETMSIQLEELLRYAFLKGLSWDSIEASIHGNSIESKREGKKYLESLQQFILQS